MGMMFNVYHKIISFSQTSNSEEIVSYQQVMHFMAIWFTFKYFIFKNGSNSCKVEIYKTSKFGDVSTDNSLRHCIWPDKTWYPLKCRVYPIPWFIFVVWWHSFFRVTIIDHTTYGTTNSKKKHIGTRTFEWMWD